MKIKYFKILVILFIAICFFLWMNNLFSPGSYPYSENYELNYPYDIVKKTIIKFKQKNKVYLVPKVSINNQGSWDLPDEPKGDPPYWYGFYFYNKTDNKILFTLIRSIDRRKTELSFVAINKGLNIGNWKTINSDFGYFENKKEKEYFENTILKLIKEDLSNNENKSR